METLTVILICLAAVYFIAELLSLFKIPRVISQICVGIVLGMPFAKTFLFDAESLHVLKFLAYLGSILLVFFVGLQINFDSFKKTAGISLRISIFNTFVPLTLGFLVSKYFFGLSNVVSIIAGVCMSVSASALALDMLEEYGKLKTKLGSLIVSAATLDDLVEILLLTTVLTLVGAAASKFSFLWMILHIILFLVILLLFRSILIPFVLRIVEYKMYRPALFTGALIITLLLAVFAEFLGIGALIGAVFGGLIIRQVLIKDKGHRPWERSEISHVIHSISFGFLVPLFFFWIGLNTNILSIWQNLSYGITITVIAILGTVYGTAFGYLITVKNWRKQYNNSLLVGWAMNAKGDTELVIAQFALGAGVISSDIFSSLIFMALVSTLISPFIFKRLLRKANFKIPQANKT